jgi:hypothetical protein
VVAFLQPAPKSVRAIAAASVKDFKDGFSIWSDGRSFYSHKFLRADYYRTS